MSQQVLGGRYRIEGDLGQGGMARVYKGTDTVLGRPVAIKVLSPQYAQDDGFVARFRREAQAAARLNNPNLVAVYDTGSDDGTHYIVMEYVEGRTLAEFIAGGGRLMPERAIELAEAACRALSFAHAHGVIHRDVKPGNIMVTRRGEVKVTDFGIARVATTGADTIAQTAAVLGTAAYLSPEQAQGQAVDERSDIYSLGVVLFEMLAGRPPFSGDSAVAVAYKHVQEVPELLSKLNRDVPPDLDAVVMKALAKNPQNRYQTAEEFREDLERARRGEPVEAPPLLPEAAAATQVIRRAAGPPTEVLPALEEERRSRWPWILVSLLVLLAVGAGAFLLVKTFIEHNAAAQLVSVPNVVGLSEEEATSRLTGLDLKVDPKHVTDPSVSSPQVVTQDPPPHQRVKAGTVVTITVARPPKMVQVPNLSGLDEEQARAAIRDAGLTVGDVGEESSDLPKGQVVGQDPAAFTPEPVRTPVDFTISSGQVLVTVPTGLTCTTIGHATAVLNHAGFQVDEQPGGFNENCPDPKRVAELVPAEGTDQPKGSTITIVESSETPSPTPAPSGN